MSLRALAADVHWRLPEPAPRLLAAAAPVMVLITLVTTVPLRHAFPSPQVLRQVLAIALGTGLLALVGVALLGPFLALGREQLRTRGRSLARVAVVALSASLLTTYTVLLAAALGDPYYLTLPWMLDLGTTLGEVLTGVLALAVGLVVSVSLTGGQITAYATGCIAGALWALPIAEPGVHDLYFSSIGWVAWGLVAAVSMYVLRQLRQS